MKTKHIKYCLNRFFFSLLSENGQQKKLEKMDEKKVDQDF